MSERTSSGGVVNGIGDARLVGKMEAGYRRKHLPADVRPARPARWFAEAREQGVVVRTSIHVLGL